METESKMSSTDHEAFVMDLIDNLRQQRQEKSIQYRKLPYFQYLGHDEVFEALDRVRQGNLQQIQQKMQKDCSYMQHMDDMTVEGRNAESVRKRVQEGKLTGGFRQINNMGQMTVCGCLDCQLRLANKQFSSSFQNEQAQEALTKKLQGSKLSFLGAVWHGKVMLTRHLAVEEDANLEGCLHAATLRGEAELVRVLCERIQCDVCATWLGASALDLAVWKGFEEVGDILMVYGAPLLHYQQESVLEAVERGSALLLRALLEGRLRLGFVFCAPDIMNIANADGNTALHLACLLPDREAMIKLLVSRNADSNLRNNDGQTPLDCCVQVSNNKAWRSLRHATGGQARLNRFDPESKSLQKAIEADCLFLVKHVHLKADEEKKGEKKVEQLNHSLVLAVSRSGVSDELVQYLVEQGADPNHIVNIDSKTKMSVLDLCLQHNSVSEAALGRHTAAKLHYYQDYTLLMAAEKNLPGLVRYLAKSQSKGSKTGVNQKVNGLAPIHVVVTKGYAEVAKVLLAHNANVNETTAAGKTALDLACEGLSQLIAERKTADCDKYRNVCATIEVLLERGAKAKEFKDDGSVLATAKRCPQVASSSVRADGQKEGGKIQGENARKRRFQEADQALREVEREIKSLVVEEDKRGEAYKESEKLAKKVIETQEVLQASIGSGEKQPDHMSSKYYQIRINVLRRKMQEKETQIEDAMKQTESNEEQYVSLLRKKMKELRLKHHPDKITGREVTDEDYKLYGRLEKAYNVLSTKEDRDKYLEMSNHVEWLQQHGENEEAKIMEKAIHDSMDNKKPEKRNQDKKKESEPAGPQKEHVERAKKKLQERREELNDSWDKATEKIKALTLGTPNKCKAPQVTAQRYSDRTEQYWLDIELYCKCASVSVQRISYELHAQDLHSSDEWTQVYRGFDPVATGVGPFSEGTYEFMARAQNSVGWGEWSDVVVVTLEDPKRQREERKEAEALAAQVVAKSVQHRLEEILEEVAHLHDENKLTIHRVSNLLVQLHAETRKARPVRMHLTKAKILKDAESSMKDLEKWRNRKEAFTEWKQLLTQMKQSLFQANKLEEFEVTEEHDFGRFLSQDVVYFASLEAPIINLVVQTLLGLGHKQVLRKLTKTVQERILTVLKQGIVMGRGERPPADEESLEGKQKDHKATTICTRFQIEQLEQVVERVNAAHATEEHPESPSGWSATTVTSPSSTIGITPLSTPTHKKPPDPVPSPKAEPSSARTESTASTASPRPRKNEKQLRTVFVSGLPRSNREVVTRDDLVIVFRDFAEVDGARVGDGSALVRFTNHENAKSALDALGQGLVCVRRSALNGRWANSDSLAEEAFIKAGGSIEPRTPQTTPGEPLNAPLIIPPPEKEKGSRRDIPVPHTIPARKDQHVGGQESQGSQPGRNTSSQESPSYSPMVAMSQLVSTDGNTSMFRCPLCSGLSWQPAYTMCCSKVFCFGCLEKYMRQNTTCPNCHSWLGSARMDSTGGPSESRVMRLDRHATGVQAVLWRVYGNLRVVCSRSGCDWTGDLFSYAQHLERNCGAEIAPNAARAADLKQNCPPMPPLQQPKPAVSNVAKSAVPKGYPSNATSPVPDASIRIRISGPGDSRSEIRATVGWTVNALKAAIRDATGLFPQEQCLLFNNAELLNDNVKLQSALSLSSSSPAEAVSLTLIRREVYTVVWDHHTEDSSQISLSRGDKVRVHQKEAHGWVYGERLNPQGHSTGEGWFPKFCLPEERPPPPQQSPPPSAPPAGAIRAKSEYEAADESQLSIKANDLVYVRSRDPSGWTFVIKVGSSGTRREGWVPDWSLDKE